MVARRAVPIVPSPASELAATTTDSVEPAQLSRTMTFVLVGAVGAVGLVARAWILRTPAGRLNSDEAVTGLGAIDALNGRFDVVIPGAAYTANFESYLFTPVVAAFGSRVLPLKLMPIILWAVGCVVLYHFIRSIAGRLAGGIAACLLWVVPGAGLVVSTQAYLAYSGGIITSTAALWAISSVAGAAEPAWRRSFVAGLLAGMALYAHPLYFATLAGPAAIASWRWRHEGRRWWISAAAGAVLINTPWLAWNVVHGFPSLEPSAVTDTTYLERLRGMFVSVWPRALGLRDFNGMWVLGRPATIVLTAAVLSLIGFGCYTLARSGLAGRSLAAACLCAAPLLSVLSATGYVSDGRYSVMLIAPSFGALAVGVRDALVWLVARRPSVFGRASTPMYLSIGLAAWIALLLVPYQLKVIGRVWGDPNAGVSSVVRRLEAENITRVSGDYWAVLPITYMSNARIPTAVVGFPIRYPYYQRIVEASDPREVAFVYSPGVDLPLSLRMPVDQYRRESIAGYTVYLPIEEG